MKYRLVSLFSIVFGTFLLIVVAAARFAFYVSTISFEMNGAAPIQSVEIEAGDTLELPNPTREGYTFGGWYLDEEFTRSANFLVLNNQDRTLFAYWVPNLYTVTFESNGGSDVDAVTQTFDSEFPAPEQPTLPGYDFAGWFLDDETFLEPFTFGTMPLDTTLYAYWTPTNYTISFVLDGGTLADGQTTSYTVEDDLVVFADPTRVGYTFEGWYDNSAFDGDLYVAINPNRMENLTLYAKWSINQYTITFDAAGGSSVSSITQDYGTTVTQPANPTKTGYTFQGWLLDNQPYTFSTMPVDGAALVASWQINTYTITLNVNGGTGVTTNQVQFDYDESITLVTPTRAGYEFNGWSDGSSTWETGDEMPNNNLSLTAQWTLIDYPITYVMDRGFNDDSNPSSYTILSSTITLATPEKEGHTFNGWFADAGFTTPSSTIPTGSTGAKTFYAKWTINTYEVSLDVDGGDPLTETTLTFNFGSTLNLPTPTRSGFDFEGWETSEGVRYGNGNLMPSQDLDLIALWEIKTYEVKYYTFKNDVTNPNKLPATDEYLLGETVTEQSISNPGYTFDGWFNAADDQPFTFGFTMTDISEPYILYGKWTPIVYTVTYILNDDEDSQATNPVENPEEFTIEDSIPLTEPQRPGYNFTGWQSDSVTVTTVGGAITNITLSAQWQLIRYDITYDTDGGINNFDNPRDFNVEETFDLLPAIKEGYTFDGWKNQNNEIMSEIPLGTSGDLTLTAQWTLNSHLLKYRNFTGQSETSVSRDYGETLGMPTPTRRGYSFDGWFDTNNGYWSDSDTMPDNPLTLVGQWTINDYTITMDFDNGNSNANFPNSYTVVDSISLASPTRTGWVFVGWDTNGDDSAEHTPTAGTTTINAGTYAEDLTIKAIWTQTVYTITFNSNGGSAVASKNYFYSEQKASSFFPTPTKSGETFTGWYDANGVRWGETTETMPNNNLSVTARWATFPYSITYEPANGENTYSTSVYPGDNVYIGFTPYREGYTFVGWKDEDEGVFYTADSEMPAKDLVLTAQWEENN